MKMATNKLRQKSILAAPVRSNGTSSVRTDVTRGDSHPRKTFDTPRFNVFSHTYALSNYCNISITPYLCTTSGNKQRIITVMSRECKHRLFLHGLQLIYLSLIIVQIIYNNDGFSLLLDQGGHTMDPKMNYSDSSSTNSSSSSKSNNSNGSSGSSGSDYYYFKTSKIDRQLDNVDFVSDNVGYLTRLCWSLIVKLISYNRWTFFSAHYRRILNVVTMMYTINNFIQRLMSLFRFQELVRSPLEESHTIGRYLTIEEQQRHYEETKQPSSICTVIRYKQLLLAPKLSLREYIDYCFTGRKLPDHLIKEHAIMKKMTHTDILKIDLMAIRYKKRTELICSSTIYKRLTTVVFTSIWAYVTCCFNGFFVIAILAFKEMLTTDVKYSTILLLFIRIFDISILTCLNTATFIETFTLTFSSVILADRLAICNAQLIQMIDECRQCMKQFSDTDHINYQHHYHHNQTMYHRQYHHINKHKKQPDIDPMNNHHGLYSDSNESIDQTLESLELQQYDENSILSVYRLKYNDKCVRMIVTVHQLLSEFRRLKSHYTHGINLDIFVSLCTSTWVVSAAIISYNCSHCGPNERLLIIFIANIAILLLSNTIIQIFFLAQITQKVCNFT